MSKKYVINIFESAQMVEQIGVNDKGEAVVCSTLVDNLEELNSDYINEHFGELQDTAYQRGFDDGKVQGQNEAWNCAKRICLHPHNGGMTCTEISNAFGEASATQVLYKCSAQQAIEKLKAYEKKQLDKIKRGDIVNVKNCCNDNLLGVVTSVGEDSCYIMWGDGSGGAWSKNSVAKTGKYIDIDKILEEMRNDS